MVAETISRTELARRTRQVIDSARRRGPVMIESYGEEQVALLDAMDFRLLRAVAAFRGDLSGAGASTAMPRGLTAAEVAEHVQRSDGDVQVAWNVVLAAYFDGDISFGRTAELLQVSRWELQDRMNRLELPMRVAHDDMSTAVAEAQVLR